MKKVLLINDLIGYGRSSITMQLPIIAACGDMASIACTSYSSNLSNLDNVHRIDLSNNLNSIFDTWGKNNLHFDACITGYLGNSDSIIEVREYLENQKLENDRMLIMVDPVIGDYGKQYPFVTEDIIESTKKLITIADIITPNLTEACFLTNIDYEDLKFKLGILEYDGKVDPNDESTKVKAKENIQKVSDRILNILKELLDKIIYKRNQITIITGIEIYNAVVTILDIYNGDTKRRQTSCNLMPKLENRPGTGDLFDAMYLEMVLKNYNLVDCLKISTGFIQESLKFSMDMKTPKYEGVCMEPILVPNLEYIRQHTNNKDINNKGEK